MCHGCVYTGAFVLDCHVLYLQHFMSIEWKSHVELFRIEWIVPRIIGLESVD